jgi:hypothetical protein
MSMQKVYRGHALSAWATRTPYNRLACFVNEPVMRVSKGDHLYMTGENAHLGCAISLHYRKRSKLHNRPAEFILRYPFNQTVRGEQTIRTFHSTDEVELFLRPPSGDLSWIETLDDNTRQSVSDALSYALLDERRELSDIERQAIGTLYYHVAPDSETLSPARYEIPEDSRRIVWAAAYRLINRLDRLEMLEEQTSLADAIIAKLDLEPSQGMTI